MFCLVGINAKYIHTNPAIRCLKAYSDKVNGAGNVETAEYTINNQVSEIVADIYKRKPAQIGFSCYIWNYRTVKEVAGDIIKLLPETDIWLGGPEVSYDRAKVVSELPYIKGIMMGEGEATFSELVKHYYGEGHELCKIKGLYLNGGTGGLCPDGGVTAPREPLDLDSVPFPYNDLSEFRNRIIYYESSRGCPFRCEYCLSSIEKSLRFRSLPLVKKELGIFLDANVPQVKFVDRTFNCNREHAMEIWRFIKENDNGITNFHFEIAADIMDDEEITLLSGMRKGLVQLEIGVQSTNERTLTAINRKTDFAKIAYVVGRLKNAGNIHIHLDLIAGLPYEDIESFRRSFDDVYSLHPDELQLGFLKVLHGTKIEEKAQEYGIVSKNEPPYEVLKTDYISYDDVILLKRTEEMLGTYYNSGQFPNSINALEMQYPSAFSMYEDMAAYYKEKGFYVNTPARSAKYKIFLEFVSDRFREKKEEFRELLIKDYRLRESGRKADSFERDFRSI